LTWKSIVEYAKALRKFYLAASKKDKTGILNEFGRVTGYHRKSAVRLLLHPPAGRGCRRGRPPKYDRELVRPLVKLWEASDCAGSKRLQPFLPFLLASLEDHEELQLDQETKEKLLSLSAATIDRLLKPFRQRPLRRPFSQAQSLTSIKALVPIRTFGDWREVKPGSLQADLVFHCGESLEGFHLTTLVAIDVSTGWTECEPIWGKGQQRVGSGVHHVREHLPFAVRELHTDNGGEFLNEVLYTWCKREGIHFTRGRPYKKNDQAHVEQRNWSLVRRLVGYDRYSSKEAYLQLGKVYRLIRLYSNFFQPISKLTRKQRVGAKVRKQYDKAKTPYQRVLEAKILTEPETQEMEKLYRNLNPVRLRAQMYAELERLWKLAERPGSTASSKTATRASAPGAREPSLQAVRDTELR